MRNLIIKNLEKSGIGTQGSYSALPEMIEDAISYIKIFGYSEWKKTTVTGIKVNNIIKEILKGETT